MQSPRNGCLCASRHLLPTANQAADAIHSPLKSQRSLMSGSGVPCLCLFHSIMDAENNDSCALSPLPCPRSHLIFAWLVPPTSRLLLLSFPVSSSSFQCLVTRYGQLWMTRLGDPLSVFSSRSRSQLASNNNNGSNNNNNDDGDEFLVDGLRLSLVSPRRDPA